MVIDVKEVTKDNTEPLDSILKLLNGNGMEDKTALELTCRVKRAELYLENVRRRLKAESNEDFIIAIKSSRDNKVLIDDIAVLTPYTLRCSWEYPRDLVSESNALNDRMKEAQRLGTAVKRIPVIDQKSSTLFSISVNNTG